ncbi:exodeoxyribonuclease VII large subunit [candidate division WOR-3 bacterium]|nr:exodeoxyribonuclease VII large subunit [candidate division WOR-3 bacterium]
MEILTISQLNGMAKRILETNFSSVAVEGEVSKATLHSSGHFYLTLKDRFSSVDAVIYKGNLRGLKLMMPSLGQIWHFQGRISLWEKTGRFIFVIETAYPAGEGAIYMKFLLLKEKLAKEGLFDRTKKRSLPKYPQKVGIVTSPTGAVIKDFVNIYRRRFPSADVILSPSAVQGENAPSELIRAMKKFINTDVQLVVVARGGGSAEDLAPFNDENLAREIAAFPLPVVSAIGHETDNCISDLAADLSAPTPSAAAELIFPDRREILDNLFYLRKKMSAHVSDKAKYNRAKLNSLSDSYSLNSVKGKINEYSALLGYRNESILKAIKAAIESKKGKMSILSERIDIKKLKDSLSFKKEIFGYKSAEVNRRMLGRLDKARESADLLEKKLSGLSPYTVLKKGYAMVYDSTGNFVSSGDFVNSEEVYDVKFYDKTWEMKAQKEKT